jgi:hypothetical protein
MKSRILVRARWRLWVAVAGVADAVWFFAVRRASRCAR